MTTKIVMALLLLLAMFGHLAAAPVPSTPGVIGPGNWTIKDPKHYKFENKSINGYLLTPALAIGANGVLLSIQISTESVAAQRLPIPQGQEFAARLLVGRLLLRQLEAPTGPLEMIMGTPFAFWNFEPPPAGQSISEIALTFGGINISWPFSSGTQWMPP